MQETRREILISDKPKWCALMMNGIKTIEVRKSKALAKAIQKLIDENGYAEIYVYCTKDSKGQLHYSKEYGAFCDIYKGSEHYSENGNLNGKIVFKFRCYRVEEFYEFNNDLCEKACIGRGEILDYLGDENGFAIHISKLEIYGEPKELWEFETTKQHLVGVIGQIQPILQNIRLTKAPQNFVYLEVEE